MFACGGFEEVDRSQIFTTFKRAFADFGQTCRYGYFGYIVSAVEYAAAYTFCGGVERIITAETAGVIEYGFSALAVKYAVDALEVGVGRGNYNFLQISTFIEYRTEFHFADVVGYFHGSKSVTFGKRIRAEPEVAAYFA